jgi:hypothetical protein
MSDGYPGSAMVRPFFAALVLLAGIAGAMAQSAAPDQAPVTQPSATQVQPPASQPPAAPAMTFEWMREGPADKCGDKCREWIFATGQIQPNTPRLFVEFAAKRSVAGATVVLDSSGGSVGGAMALGRLFRRLSITTTVGHAQKLPSAGGSDERATLSPQAVCASMCAFVVLGGARRHVPPEARILVHQIWPRVSRDDAIAGNYSAKDLVAVQRDLGMLAKYVVDMGGDIELFELALRIPPWEILRPLNATEIDRVKLRNVDDPFNANARAANVATTEPASPALPAIKVPTDRPLDVLDRAWATNDAYGLRAFSRRHPLTIEGEQIGAFELSFVCGDAGVSAIYVEQRKPRSATPTDRVARVGIGAGKERALLKVQSSTPESGDVRTIAQGLVTPDFLAVLSETAGQSLVIATQTDTNVRTAIRPGNTGFGDSFRQTVAECRK